MCQTRKASLASIVLKQLIAPANVLVTWKSLSMTTNSSLYIPLVVHCWEEHALNHKGYMSGWMMDDGTNSNLFRKD